MNEQLRRDACRIMRRSLEAVQSDTAVTKALATAHFPGRVLLLAIGKAAWAMAQPAVRALGPRLERGLVITKYKHSRGPLPGCTILEAGHPIPDENSYRAARAALELCSGLKPEDTILFLISGGGSALFELPKIAPEELSALTAQLLACGAEISEINTIRKRLSRVKGGRFARHCAPARIFSVVLSDVLGDPLDVIASGPAYPDSSTSAQALAIIEKYQIKASPQVLACLAEETPKELPAVETVIAGSVTQLCQAARNEAAALGYESVFLSDRLACEAREAGRFLAAIAQTQAASGRKIAYIAGGETVVHLSGNGLGGRNQELALAAAEGLDGLPNALIFSLGSDGTDGPTDAAGGLVDGSSAAALRARGISLHEALRNNDAYHALEAIGGLIKTGPTGSNVNDLSVLLIGER